MRVCGCIRNWQTQREINKINNDSVEAEYLGGENQYICSIFGTTGVPTDL